MTESSSQSVHQVVVECDDLQLLLEALRKRAYQVIGPTVRDGAIVYDDLTSAADLPIGWTDVQEAGTYRLKKRPDAARFGYAVGPRGCRYP